MSSNSRTSRRSRNSVAWGGDAGDDNNEDLAVDDRCSVGQLSRRSNSSHGSSVISDSTAGGSSTIATESYHFVRNPTPKKVAPQVPFLPIAEDNALESDDLNLRFSGFNVTGNSTKPSSFLSAGGGRKSDASCDSRRSHRSSHSQGSVQSSSQSREGSRRSSQQSRAPSTAGMTRRSRDVPGRHTSQHSVKSKHSFSSSSKKSGKDTITSSKKSSGQSSLPQPFSSSISKSSSRRKLQNAQPDERSNSSNHGERVPPSFISVPSLSDDTESLSHAAQQPLNTTQNLFKRVDDLLTLKDSDVEDLHEEIITAHTPSESCCSLTYNTGHQEEQHSIVSKVSSAKSNIASHTRSKHRKQK